MRVVFAGISGSRFYAQRERGDLFGHTVDSLLISIGAMVRELGHGLRILFQ